MSDLPLFERTVDADLNSARKEIARLEQLLHERSSAVVDLYDEVRSLALTFEGSLLVNDAQSLVARYGTLFDECISEEDDVNGSPDMIFKASPMNHLKNGSVEPDFYTVLARLKGSRKWMYCADDQGKMPKFNTLTAAKKEAERLKEKLVKA